MPALARQGLAAAACLALVFAGRLDAQPAPAPRWAQAASDLAPDPAVRFGVLPNGMRYAIMRNDTPAGETSLRLRIGSGSLEESDDEQGLAHVLEHMAFRGSKNVPPGEMMKILERDGLAFGPDTNAATEWTQTVFQLDIPHTDAKTLGDGLMLMREQAGSLLLDPKLLNTERGVVLSEERLRDTPEFRAEKSQLQLILDHQLAARRFPIGKVDVIEHAPASLVRRFYEANYRPDRTTLIAVGDFDPAVMEARIKALFGDWKPVGPPTAEPDLGKVEPRGLTVREVSLPGASTRTILAWVRPFDPSPDTFAKEKRETIENLALAVLNRRLQRIAQEPNPPFISAGAAFENLFRSAKVAAIETTSAPDAWKPALQAADREVRQLVAFGVSPQELQREIRESRTQLQNAVAGAPTRPTSALADELVRTVDQDEVFTPPSEDLKVFDAAVQDLTPAEVDAAVRRIFAGAGPLVELAGPAPVVGGEAAVTKAFTEAAEAPLQAHAAHAAIAWPYTSFGPPGRVESRRTLADLGVTQVTFANGVRLSVKPTTFRKNQILVSMDLGSGRLDLPRDRSVDEWTASAFIAGGLGKLSAEDAAQALAGRVYGAGFSLGDEAFQFAGGTRPEDLDTQLQVFAAYLTDPGFRPEALERARTEFISLLPQLEATPDGVMRMHEGALLHSGDPRFTFPTRAELEGAKVDDMRRLLVGPLKHGRIEVTIVGDVTVEAAVDAVASTLGALPPRDPAPTVRPGDLETRFPRPTPEPIVLTDTGRPDQAIAAVAWPQTGFFTDMKAARADILTGAVLGNRILDQVRIAQGATYSPETSVNLSEVFPDYGYTFSLVEMPPATIPAFFESANAIAKAIAENGVTEDELTRARNPRVANIVRSQATNEYWLGALDDSQADPRRLALVRTTLPDYRSLTTADLQAAARRWLRPDAEWKLIVRAAPTGAPTH